MVIRFNILPFCFFLLFGRTANSHLIFAYEIVEKQISAIQKVAKTADFNELLTLVSSSVFELEDGEEVRKALLAAKIKILKAKFHHPGIFATVLENDIHLSNITMRRHEKSSTGWILVRAGFLECIMNQDEDSFCIED
ncbi:hypothetical protein L3Y34_012762 [Caenorhabditis briggsae]|uniref:Uncharacterized protein n=1 Tax=Caenorhabditis briggsae TaxID=6238 RepID=A0AAE8ZQ21_CAEBR|nr:hypothetical protein L3Y34_012762 [Caenorhabditis briggsae]